MFSLLVEEGNDVTYVLTMEFLPSPASCRHGSIHATHSDNVLADVLVVALPVSLLASL